MKGTQQELIDVYNAINGSRALRKYLKNSRPGNIDANEIADILKSNIGAEIKYNPNEANEYKNTDGKNVSHDYIIKWINSYNRVYDGHGM